MPKLLALVSFWALGSGAAVLAVTEPHLVADLGTELSSYAGSVPHGLAAVGGRVVFAAQPDDHADRLFQSDGTAGGTTALAAPCAALEPGQITLLHAHPGRAFYEVRCGFGGAALWATDGRAAGTGPLIAAGEFRRSQPFYGAPQWVDEGDRVLFLQGGNYASPLELWATDGTAAGTLRLGVLTQQTGATGALARRADGDYLLLVWEHFAALTVWRSDGTAAGTVPASPIDLGSTSFSVRAFAATSDGIYFLIDGGALGARQLWYSGGTVGETRWLADFEAGVWAGLVAHDGAVYFAAEAFGGAGIWRSDGTPATTRRIVELASFAISSDSFAFLDDRIYWLGFAWSGVSGALYGAPIAGGVPEELLQTCIGSYCSPHFDGYWLRTVGESLVFSRFAGGAAAVWRSGGVAGDASLLAPLCEALDCDFGGYGPVVLADRLLFVHRTAGEAQELWLCDGTAAGTLRLAGPLRSLSWLSPGLTDPVAGLPADAGWLFAADDGEHGRELWHAGGQADSGRLVSDLRLDRPGLEAVESVGRVGDTFLFALPQEDGTRTLYRHDRGAPGVAPFLNIPVIRGRYGSRNPPPSLRPAGDAWYLFESDFDGDQSSEDFAQQVWRYDPVSGESRPIFADLATTGVGALAHDFYPAGEDYVLLGREDPERSPAIYLLQAATGEVSKLLDLPATSVWSIGRSGGIWFLLEDWRRIVAFDLTRRTRTVVAEFPGAAIYVADALPFGLIFEVVVWPTTTGDGRKELWQSDGTAAGTQEIARWSNRAGGCTWVNLPPRSANSSVLFSVQTSCEPVAELWISDGSAERTRPLRTFTGEAPGVAEGGVRYRGELYFLARSLGVPAPDRRSLRSGRATERRRAPSRSPSFRRATSAATGPRRGRPPEPRVSTSPGSIRSTATSSGGRTERRPGPGCSPTSSRGRRAALPTRSGGSAIRCCSPPGPPRRAGSSGRWTAESNRRSSSPTSIPVRRAPRPGSSPAPTTGSTSSPTTASSGARSGRSASRRWRRACLRRRRSVCSTDASARGQRGATSRARWGRQESSLSPATAATSGSSTRGSRK